MRTQFSKLRIAGVIRVLGLAVVVQLLAVALWIGSAHARASESLLSVGAQLMQVAGARANQPPRSVFVNGITVHLRTATTPMDLHAVLEQFHRVCRQRTGVEAPQAVLDKLRRDGAKGAPSGGSFDGVLVAESGTEGALACIDTGTRLSVKELTSRLQEFAKTGDLSAVGELRYVLARRVDGVTAVLTMWTEGETPLLRMFPPTGDAPGQDPQDVPRARGMRRLLSTWENGEPYSMTVYTAESGTVSALTSFYVDKLRRAGWAVEVNTVRPAALDVSAIVARRAAQTLMVRIGSDLRGATAVSVAVLD